MAGARSESDSGGNVAASAKDEEGDVEGFVRLAEGAADLNGEVPVKQERQTGGEAQARDSTGHGGSVGNREIEYALEATRDGAETQTAIGVNEVLQGLGNKLEEIRKADLQRIDVKVNASVIAEKQRRIA